MLFCNVSFLNNYRDKWACIFWNYEKIRQMCRYENDSVGIGTHHIPTIRYRYRYTGLILVSVSVCWLDFGTGIGIPIQKRVGIPTIRYRYRYTEHIYRRYKGISILKTLSFLGKTDKFIVACESILHVLLDCRLRCNNYSWPTNFVFKRWSVSKSILFLVISYSLTRALKWRFLHFVNFSFGLVYVFVRSFESFMPNQFSLFIQVLFHEYERAK